MYSRIIKSNLARHYCHPHGLLFHARISSIALHTKYHCSSNSAARVHEALPIIQSTDQESEEPQAKVQSINTVNASVDPKKLRKKIKRRRKFALLRQLKTLRTIKKYGLLYHGIDTTQDFKSKLELLDDPDYVDPDEAKSPPMTDDDLYWQELKEQDELNEDYTDVPIEEIRSETYKMENYYHGDESKKQNILRPHPKDKRETAKIIDSANMSEFGKDFASLGICQGLVDALKYKGITEPTDIQKKVIPHLLYKMGLVKDCNTNSKVAKRHVVELNIFGERTGTGKTLAFLLPIIEAIKRDVEVSNIPLRMNRPRALILAPTRELCEQIRNVLRDLSPFIGISSYVLTAGTNTKNQLKKLRTGIDIVVGTPKRIKEHIDKSAANNPHSHNAFTLVDTRYVVLDEGDVLLNEGFWEDEVYDILRRIGCLKANEVDLKSNPKVRGGIQKVSKISKYSKPIQIIISSATMTREDITSFCNHLGFNPGIRMITGESLHCILPAMNMHFWDATDSQIDKLQALKAVLRQEQILHNSKLREQYKENFDENLLMQQIEKPKYIQMNSNYVPQQTMIFCRTKQCAAAVSHFLDENNYNNILYFGVDSPFNRKNKYESFVSGEVSILVSTDVGMRGLDICNVSHVILYDFPHSPRAFIHRVGRTGRINTVSNYDDNTCKISALIDKHDVFIATAIMTAMNEGKSLVELTMNKRKYKAYPHLKLKTAASNVESNNCKLVPFEAMPLKLLTPTELEERKKAKKLGKFYKKYQKQISKKEVDRPRLWWYSDRLSKTRVPFFNIKKKITKRLMRQKDEDERRRLLLKYTTERRELPGGWMNNRNRRRMKKPGILKMKRYRKYIKT